MDVMDVVRAHDLQPEFAGEPEESRNDLALFGDPVVLDLHEIILAAEYVDEPRSRRAGLLPSVVDQVLRDKRRETSGEADQALSVAGWGSVFCSGPVIKTLQVGVAHELQEVLIAPDVTGQEAEVKDAPSLVAAALLVQPGALGEIELAANQRLDPLALRGRVEINGAKEVAMVGEGERRHPELARPVGQPVDPDRKSTRLNSSHLGISYAVFCLKKKKQ